VALVEVVMMDHISKIWNTIIAAFIIVSLASSFVSGGTDTDDANDFFNERLNSTSDDAPATRSDTSSGENFEISSTTPVLMPEIEDVWIQDDWSGGGGQELWDNYSKYNTEKNLDYAQSPGNLLIDKGGTIMAWKQVDDAPVERYHHRMVWAESRGVFYMFGGYQADYTKSNALYEYKPSTGAWKEIEVSGSKPLERVDPALVWDSENNWLWVYGGQGTSLLNDLWVFNPTLNSWTQRTDGPSARSYAVGVCDPGNELLIFYGGYQGDLYNPSPDVFIYNIKTGLWHDKNSFVPRYYHRAVWVPETETMMVIGGVHGYQTGVGWDYAEEMNEYFPGNDTWVNRTGPTGRKNPMVSWDPDGEKIILVGGNNPSVLNETLHYDLATDKWTKIFHGVQASYDPDGAWDTINKNFVVFGGSWYGITHDVFVFSPYTPAYKESGELISSVFDAGNKVNPSTVSFKMVQPQPSGGSSTDVRIQIAATNKGPDQATNFYGPSGTITSYYTTPEGQSIPDSMKGNRYFAYKVNISTDDQLFTPEVDYIKFSYSTYPDKYDFESPVYEITGEKGLPLRYVEWTSNEKSGTAISIFFRQSDTELGLADAPWEQVSKGQTTFEFRAGRFFQYKAELTTTEPSISPELKSIRFVFNRLPDKPTLVLPENEGWVGSKTPSLSWLFNDPDTEDLQSALQVYIAKDQNFNVLVYTSDEVISEESSYQIDLELTDGEYYWKVRTSDNYGSWGPWSEPNLMYVHSKPPSTPRIECYSHPMENVWYNNAQPRFDWSEPKDPAGIDGYSYSIDQSPLNGPPDEVMITNDDYLLKHKMSDFNGFLAKSELLSDGIWYFHLKALNNLGQWSEVATRKVMIDAKAPEIEDFTPELTQIGQQLQFKFGITDNESGVDKAVLYWKYPSDMDYQFDEIQPDQEGFYTYDLTIKSTTDSGLEYYISVVDKSEPVNEVTYPELNTKLVFIVDNQIPVIDEVSGDFEHNPYADLRIIVKPSDNVGISEVRIIFNDEVNGRMMTKASDGSYYYEIKRAELSEMMTISDENALFYKVLVWDYSNNMAMLPEYGNYKITVKEIESDDTKDDSTTVEPQGIPRGMLINIIALVVFVIVVAVVLVVFIKKQSAKMTEDRHKLRMAIADMNEGPVDVQNTAVLFSGGSNKNSPNLAPLEETRQLITKNSELPALPPASTNNSSSASPPKPRTIQGKDQPAVNSRATADTFPFSNTGDENECGLYSDVSAYDNENGPVKDVGNLDKLHLMEEIGKKELETEASQKPKVEIEPGLSISLPTGKSKAFSNARPIGKGTTEAKPGSGFWRPPEATGSWSPPKTTSNLDLSRAKKFR